MSRSVELEFYSELISIVCMTKWMMLLGFVIMGVGVLHAEDWQVKKKEFEDADKKMNIAYQEVKKLLNPDDFLKLQKTGM